jgi:hypothetical protein
MRIGKLRVRLAMATATAIGTVGAVAPSAFSSTSSPIATATAHGVNQGGGQMRLVVQCEAVSKVPAAATEVSCSAGSAPAPVVRVPGQVAASAGTGVAALAPYTLCVRATTYPVLGLPASVSNCAPSVFGEAVVVAL